MIEKVFFKVKDRLRLCGVWHIPQKSTNRAIVLTHGITADKDESGIFIKLAKKLSENEFAVFRFDSRAHGESEGGSSDFTIAHGLSDLDSVINLVKSKYKTIGLVGASFGGGISVLYSAKKQKNIKSLCLWNPCLNYEHVFLKPYLPWLKDKINKIENDFKEKGWTLIGSSKYKVDKNLWDEMKNLKPFEELKKISIATVIIHGEKDKHVPYDDSKNYINNLENGKLITVSQASHGFHDSESISDYVITKTLKFFLKNL